MKIYARIRKRCGEWIPYERYNSTIRKVGPPDKYTNYRCSECGHRNGRNRKDKYCPNCGTRMHDRRNKK